MNESTPVKCFREPAGSQPSQQEGDPVREDEWVYFYDRSQPHSYQDELTYVLQHDPRGNRVFAAQEWYYLISADWLSLWSKYTHMENHSSDAGQSKLFAVRPEFPCKIRNKSLTIKRSSSSGSNRELAADKRLLKDYRIIRADIFKYLFPLYGCDLIISFRCEYSPPLPLLDTLTLPSAAGAFPVSSEED